MVIGLHDKKRSYSATKKNEILPFAATWMDLEGIMLSEMSVRERQILYDHLWVESKKYNKLLNVTKKETDSQIIDNKLVVTG